MRAKSIAFDATVIAARLFKRVEIPAHGSACWIWTGTKDKGGYGMLRVGHSVTRRAHRVAYQLFRGAPPSGLEADHLCRNTSCVNPWHLEMVTPRENVLRSRGLKHIDSNMCVNGHPLTPDNIVYSKRSGGRYRLCGACQRAYDRGYRARINALTLADTEK